MYNIFKYAASSSRGSKVNNDLNRLLWQQNESCEKLIAYEQKKGSIVDGRHPLIRVFHTLPVLEPKVDASTYYNSVRNEEIEIGNSIDITNSHNEGKIFDDLFFMGKTIFLQDREVIPFTELLNIDETNWKTRIVPLKCLRLSSFVNQINDAKPESSQMGLEDYSVVSLNIPKLGLMYYYWKQENAKRPSDERETPAIFISRYVIPNMYKSQMQAGLVNDLYTLLSGFSIIKEKPETSFWVIDRNEEMLKEYEEMIEGLPLKSYEFDEILFVMPSYEDKVILSHIPNLMDQETLNNKWAILAASIDMISLAALLVSNSSSGLSELRTRFKVLNRHIKNNGILRKIDDKDIRETLSSRLDEIADLF